MLKRRLCEARFTWRLKCEGPLLIADGRYEKKKDEKDKGKRPDKVFISRASQKDVERAVAYARTSEDLRLPFYVPGTSLRGPLRAQAERILRTVIASDPPRSACDPFQNEAGATQSCSKRLDETHAEVPYAEACPACRLFGCTGTASRIQISDADVKGAKSVFRDMIGIDRFTGGVFQGEIDDTGEKKKSGGANMRFHALEGASFSTQISVLNFELWQLGLLAFVFRDFAEGLVSIGFGKTKGFGQVKGTIEKIELLYPAGRQAGRIQHLGALASSEERTHYDLSPFEAPELAMKKNQGAGPFQLFDVFEVEDTKAFWDAVAPSFMAFVASREAA